jgi:hypothetical protein
MPLSDRPTNHASGRAKQRRAAEFSRYLQLEILNADRLKLLIFPQAFVKHITVN